MTGPTLIDSNVLVYAYDISEPDKAAVALNAIDDLARRGFAVLSTQVLAEFFVAVTRRIPDPLPTADASRSVVRYAGAFPVLPVTAPIVREALRGVAAHGLSYWDAQVWATARLNQVETILTEDTPGRAEIDGVRYVNPFPKT